MSNEINLDYITNNLSQLTERLETAHKRVKHGKLKVQRKKIKSQVMKDHKPVDREREEICKKAREKAHTSVADARRNISNDVRKNVKEGLTVVNPHALTLSEAYGFDFIEEACAFTPMNVEVTFFDKAEVTAVSESLDFGKTASGRKRKGKAIGIAEGVFAPIEDKDGNSVFSRNRRLYESNFWCYQLENANVTDRVDTRRMLGTIGHYDKKVDDKDLAEGKVSHIVTNLEIREDDEHGRYLWGRLEILNTPAGRLLKEYYDNEIPLFVSSRGGGKLLDVPGKDYKLVDKDRYYCETFDVVKEPGFLEACPEYHSESFEETQVSESLQNEVITEENEDINMSEEQVKCNIKADDSMEEIVRKVLNPMNETLSKLTSLVEQMRADMYVAEDAEEPAAEEAPADAEEPAKEEAPAEEVAEAKEACPKCGKEKCECEDDCKCDKEEKKDEKVEEAVEEVKEEAAEEPKAEEAPVEEVAEEPVKEEVAEEQPAKEEAPAEEPKAEEEPAAEPVKEDAEEAPAEEPVKEPVKEDAEAPAEEPKVEEPAEAEEPAKEEAPVAEAAEEQEAGEDVETEQVVDYQAMYEQMKSEVEDATKQIEELMEMFKDLGKKHKEVVVEAEEAEKQLLATKNELNSYKLSEKFNITIEEASEMLSSKSYEVVEEELTAAEAKEQEAEAQAKAEQVSESISEPEAPKAPVSRKVFSVFSADVEVSEAVEAKPERKIFSWFN